MKRFLACCAFLLLPVGVVLLPPQTKADVAEEKKQTVEIAKIEKDIQQKMERSSQLEIASRVKELMESRGLEVYLDNSSSWIMKGSTADIRRFEEFCIRERGEVWVNKNIEYRVVCEVRE